MSGEPVVSWLGVWSLARRELVRFIRQRNRVFGALAQPLIFWAIFGIGLNASFQPAGHDNTSYAAYFFPGTVVLVLLFTAIFSTISIIEDRTAGFLQGVLVAPVSTATIVLGKLAGATVLALGQGLLVLLLAPLASIPLSPGAFLEAVPLLMLIAFALSGLGLTIAWKMDSTQGFHAIMMSFLMPMWFLSGAFFPATGLPIWLEWIIRCNPLTYGVAALRHIMFAATSDAMQIPSLPVSLTVVVVFAVAMFALVLRVASDRSAGARA
jgi:ABC-2 type transport system permease protein